MTIEDLSFIRELDPEQRAAVVTEENTVVSAGAGSGKTKVLCARYLWLIMTGRCEVDHILTITFTNKAANEMHHRIYSLLSKHALENEYARKAVENFHKAWISTLDSFCLGIARNASPRYGISPGFESSETKVKKEARSLALRFVLDKRNNPALEALIAEKKMRKTADELFAKPVLFYSTVSSPLDFNTFEKIQKEEILKQWDILVRNADVLVALALEKYQEQKPGSPLYEYLSVSFSCKTKAPDLAPLFNEDKKSVIVKDGIIAYCNFLEHLSKCKKNYIKKSDADLKEAIEELRNLSTLLQALANNALQWDIVREVFPLIAEFEEMLNKKKREAGILTFNDIARLAVDSLRQYEDLRKMYRDSFRMIMIDEFQDNNSLQRDLVDLLADPAKVFYVGDEKQSIYLFRGADVSVFRSLAENADCALGLNRNYRSRPALIHSFNLVFGGYTREDDSNPQTGVFPLYGTKAKNFEAVYRWINTRDDTNNSKNINPKDTEPLLCFAFFDEGRRNEEDFLKPIDYEALYIARTIKDLYDRKTLIYNKGNERSCTYDDFAVLERSHTHQHSLERAFKLYGIPYYADRPASLFYDAPVNDLWAFLKLLVYPSDKIAYGTLLRSPFVRLSEDAFSVCMLHGGTIFDLALDELLPPLDLRRYREARRSYLELLLDARDLPLSSLITKLWYEYGCRHEALWSLSTQVYLNLYDLFFEQGRKVEEQGGSLVDFLDYLEDLDNKEEKPDDSMLPGEESSGVRIMTIHRSKGLEFPIVFVYNCGSAEKTSLGEGLAFYSDRWGIFINTPQPEELPMAKNYFSLSEEKEYHDKVDAELKRLLYVAMTRAEDRVYITASIPKQTQKEKEKLSDEMFNGYGKEYIIQRFLQYNSRQDIESLSFLRLLPDLTNNNPLYTIEAIDCHKYHTQQKNISALSLEETTLQVMPCYEALPVVPPYHFVPQIVSASSLHTKASVYLPMPAPGASYTKNSETLDELLLQTGVKAEDFGTIVHSFIEALFNRIPPKLPSRFTFSLGSKNQKDLALVAEDLAEVFFNSTLGRKAYAASFRKTEYPILTAVESPQRRIIVSGKIDLLFDDGNSMYVVDFKTDKDEDIGRHAGQLAVYKRAAEDIFGKPAECRLFFLRSGNEVDLNETIRKTSPEELVAIWENSKNL